MHDGTPLHVTNGDSTLEILHQTGLAGDLLAWADVLHEGPVPDVARPELRRLFRPSRTECSTGVRVLAFARATRGSEGSTRRTVPG